MTRPECRNPPPRGFTLVEILIVVVILGVLAAIVIPQFADAANATSKAAFATDIRNFATAIERYMATTGLVPADGSSGQLPAELADLIREDRYEDGTPIGGVWDIERNGFTGASVAVGVHFDGTGQSRDDDYMTTIDELIDDGDLETGGFRRLASDRYYLVVRPD